MERKQQTGISPTARGAIPFHSTFVHLSTALYSHHGLGTQLWTCCATNRLSRAIKGKDFIGKKHQLPQTLHFTARGASCLRNIKELARPSFRVSKFSEKTPKNEIICLPETAHKPEPFLRRSGRHKCWFYRQSQVKPTLLLTLSPTNCCQHHGICISYFLFLQAKEIKMGQLN